MFARKATVKYGFASNVNKGLRGNSFISRSKFIPFREDLCSTGPWCIGKQIGSHISCLSCKQIEENLSSISSPLKSATRCFLFFVKT